jgi:hypothetical protein
VLYGTWLKDVRAQEKTQGVDHRELACYASLLTARVQDELSRALRGLELLYIRIPAVALHEDFQRDRWENYRTEYIREIREALDHIGAALAAVGCTDEELAGAHQTQCSAEDEEEPEEPTDESSEEDSSDGIADNEETVKFPVVVLPLQRTAQQED